MQLITPDFGLIFWMIISFGIVVAILRIFAWKPILNSLKERQERIQESLDAAKKAREEVKKKEAEHERLMQEARQEREKILKEAKEKKDEIIAEAKKEASQEAEKIKEQARTSIEHEKSSAIKELKNTVANLSVDIAEKLLRKELSGDKEQEELIESYMKDIDIN